MVAIPLPDESAPGEHVHQSGGRLINCAALPLVGQSAAELTRRRVPGLTSFATSSNTGFRGARQIGANLFSAWASASGKVYKVDIRRRCDERADRQPAGDGTGVPCSQQRSHAGHRRGRARRGRLHGDDDCGVGLRGHRCRRAELGLLPQRLLHLQLWRREDARDRRQQRRGVHARCRHRRVQARYALSRRVLRRLADRVRLGEHRALGRPERLSASRSRSLPRTTSASSGPTR